MMKCSVDTPSPTWVRALGTEGHRHHSGAASITSIHRQADNPERLLMAGVIQLGAFDAN
jgi:hypothetical protein